MHIHVIFVNQICVFLSFFFWVILHVTINNEINILAFVYKFIVLHVVIKRVIKLEQDAIKKKTKVTLHLIMLKINAEWFTFL